MREWRLWSKSGAPGVCKGVRGFLRKLHQQGDGGWPRERAVVAPEQAWPEQLFPPSGTLGTLGKTGPNGCQYEDVMLVHDYCRVPSFSNAHAVLLVAHPHPPWTELPEAMMQLGLGKSFWFGNGKSSSLAVATWGLPHKTVP